MIVVVNDANILIDLVKLKLLPHFFSLDLAFHTSSLILAELHQEQLDQLQEYIDSSRLNVIELSENELIDIIVLQSEKPQLSEQDCSSIVCTRKVRGELLTSDNTLRKYAVSKDIIVRGHLWIFDHMIEQQTITVTSAIAKFEELKLINPRLGLPLQECEKRLVYWKSLV
jgi:predicted nucleic acid-binding protein